MMHREIASNTLKWSWDDLQISHETSEYELWLMSGDNTFIVFHPVLYYIQNEFWKGSVEVAHWNHPESFERLK